MIKMILGEERNLSFLIKSMEDKNAVFNIWEATYELYEGCELEDSGQCTIEDHTLTAFISPKKRSNNYFLIITYKIANEVLKDRYRIEVV